MQMITQLLFVLFFPGEDELEISPYDDTLMDTRMASLVAGKDILLNARTTTAFFICLLFLLSEHLFTPL